MPSLTGRHNASELWSMLVVASRFCVYKEPGINMTSHYLTASLSAGYSFNLW